MQRIGATVILSLAVLFAVPATAQVSRSPFNLCEGKEPASADVRVDACTKVIELGGLTEKSLSRTFNNRGVAYADKGEIDRAMRDYDEALRRDPTNAVAHNNRGVAFRKKHAYDRAIQELDAAIRLNAGYAHAYLNRCNAYQNKSEYDRAIADCDEAIRLAPQDAVAFNSRGNAFNDRGDDERAIRDYDRAIELDPNYSNAFNNRGVAYEDRGDYERAIADYSRAVALNSTYLNALQNRADAYVASGQPEKAIEDYGRVLQNNPADAHALNGRCQARTASGQAEAIADCTEAVRLQPREARYFATRGFAYLKLGRPDDAIKDFDLALQWDSGLAQALYGRGQARLAKGDATASKADMTAATAIEPDIEEEMDVVVASTSPTQMPEAGKKPKLRAKIQTWTKEKRETATKEWSANKVKFADCRSQANEQDLTGHKNWTFVARCMRKRTD